VGKQQSYLIIGNGITGVTAAETLRAADATCSITIVADEFFPVYYRPALKDYLAGRLTEERLWARPSTFYQQQRVRFVPGHVMGIQAEQRYVQLHDGQRINYDKLLLAHGGRARRLLCPGQDLAGVMTLRNVTDYQQLLLRLTDAKRIVVCGSGTLALESTEALRHLGYEIIHLLRYNTIWPEVLDATASDLVLQEERRDGIDVRTEEEIAELVGTNGQVSEVITTRGTHIPCDLVLIAIGIEPHIDFVRASGIACGRGVQVDATMRTNMPGIYAAGDVVETRDVLTGRTRVVGQWYPAIQQAQIAAKEMLEPESAQREKPLRDTLYNATFLYGLDFVSLGQTIVPQQAGYYELIAEPQPRAYRKIVFQQGIPTGILFLGRTAQAFAYKRAIDQRVNLTSILNFLFADDFDLADWLDGQHVPPATIDETDAEQGTQAAMRSPAGAVLVPVPHPRVVVSLEEKPLQLTSENALFLIGRQQDAALFIDHTSVSRLHAEITYVHGQYLVRDMDSFNGTFVNMNKLAPGAMHVLKPHDMIRFGDVRVSFQAPEVAKRESDSAKDTHVVAGGGHRSDMRILSEKHVKFEIDMCIGCDRCMAACPIPLSAQVSISDLNHATISPEVAPHVARFTDECILCGSCVPVCPVDNHRDLLMVSLKQRFGSSWESPIDETLLQQALPQGISEPLLINLLRTQSILQDPQLVPTAYLLHLALASQFLQIEPGTTVLRQGEYGRNLYMILDGTLVLSASDVNEKEIPLAILSVGELIGEYGMLTGQPYNTTARAQTAALVLQIPEQVMQRLMELVPSIKNFFTGLNADHFLASILKRLALFQGVADDMLQYLISQAQVTLYDRNARLFSEEEQGRPARETVHILLEGIVKVARQKMLPNMNETSERIIAYRQSGDYFVGGLDLLGDSRAVTVTAINRTHVAEIPYLVIQFLFQRYPEVEQRFRMRVQEYMASNLSMQTGAMPALSISSPAAVDAMLKANFHTLVDDGVVEGTEVLVIDLDTCIHCSECEEACARRHGRSRMNRKGVVLNNLTVVTACRQCQDPVCMLCSRAGIARLPNGEVYITDSCIGCGICAERCPYDAISIVDIENEVESEALSGWQRFSEIFHKGIVTERQRRKLPVLNGQAASSGKGNLTPGPLERPQQSAGYEEMRKKVAIKCDLCAGYNDQACVQACPVGAAFRVRPSVFFGTTEEILKR
jgi:NADPH-dependent 2,4-dienoyl-CoA reductase/sulfur reductase-like enzyme/Fe-S-cluster-containing hydrogenase component 2/CRP-like cAMP-binding protein/pSer/pThr/pTyr-binding forkhead associated (FHA) protein